MKVKNAEKEVPVPGKRIFAVLLCPKKHNPLHAGIAWFSADARKWMFQKLSRPRVPVLPVPRSSLHLMTEGRWTEFSDTRLPNVDKPVPVIVTDLQNVAHGVAKLGRHGLKSPEIRKSRVRYFMV